MKIMGLGNGVHWLAWFVNAFVVMLITIFLFCIILKVCFSLTTAYIARSTRGVDTFFKTLAKLASC
jgi:hypothetical protein